MPKPKERPMRKLGQPATRPDVTEAHYPTQLDRIESLLLQLTTSIGLLLNAIEDQGEDDEGPKHDLDGNPIHKGAGASSLDG